MMFDVNSPSCFRSLRNLDVQEGLLKLNALFLTFLWVERLI